MGTPIVEVFIDESSSSPDVNDNRFFNINIKVTYDEETEEWNISRTSTLFYQLIKLRSVDFKFKLEEEFDEITPDKRDVRSIVTVEGDSFKHVSKAKKEGVTGHTVVTEFKGHECTRSEWHLNDIKDVTFHFIPGT